MGRSWCRGMTGDLVWIFRLLCFPVLPSLFSVSMHVSSSFLLLPLFSFHQHSVLSAVLVAGLTWGLVMYRVGSLAAGFSEKGVLSRQTLGREREGRWLLHVWISFGVSLLVVTFAWRVVRKDGGSGGQDTTSVGSEGQIVMISWCNVWME